MTKEQRVVNELMRDVNGVNQALEMAIAEGNLDTICQLESELHYMNKMINYYNNGGC